MPTTLKVDKLFFDFADNVATSGKCYDHWVHYRSVWNKPPRAPQKSMDVVAVQDFTPSAITWLIEAKDFRIVNPAKPPKPCNVKYLHDTVMAKVVDTLAGLADAGANATDPMERTHATKVLAAATRRLVLHLEPHTGPHTALFPAGFPALVLQKLRVVAKSIDPNPLVLKIANTASANVPWIVR